MSVNATGGSFKCVHGIDTFDVNEWNDHCSDPANGHTLTGATRCIDCDCQVTFEEHPYVPLKASGHGLELRCPDCFGKYVGQYDQGNTANSFKITAVNPNPNNNNLKGTTPQ